MQPKRGAICDCDLGLPRPPLVLLRVRIGLVGAGVPDGPSLDVFQPIKTRTLRWAQYLSCAWQERYWRERTAYEV